MSDEQRAPVEPEIVDVPQQKERSAREPIRVDSTGMFEPTTAEQVHRIALSVIESGALPNHINNTHMFCVAWNVLAGMGLKPMAYMSKTYWNQKTQTLGIQVEVFTAAVLKHPEYQGRREWLIDERYRTLDQTNWMDLNPEGAICVVRRKQGEGSIDTEARFSMREAHALGLAGKQNWKCQPGNMLAIRARGKAFKEAFADVIGGVALQGYDEWDDSQAQPYSVAQRPQRQPVRSTLPPLKQGGSA